MDSIKGDNNNTKVVGLDDIIKPSLTIDDARYLAETLYCIPIYTIKPLTSYNDQNFYIVAKDTNSDKLKEYNFKILNATDSSNTKLMEAQIEVLLFLNKKGISCPKPIQLPNGEYMTYEKLNGQTGTYIHSIRLLSFLPGVIYKNAELTPDLCYQGGKHIASIDVALKDFKHEGFNRPNFLWSLHNVPILDKYIHVFEEEDKQTILKLVITAFKEKVIPNYNKLSKGTIHGDYNDSNILVNATVQSSKEHGTKMTKYEITGMLDFHDLSYSYYLFEIAIALAYTMVESKDPLLSGGHMLAGYLSGFNLSGLEKELLYYCVASRIAQSLTYGMFTFKLHPYNTYALNTQKSGWDVLKMLWKIPNVEVQEKWEDIIRSH
ncbi:hydroxylysine kinase-like [Glandiceps talaboti]